jgi:hypothetical protein
MTVVLIAESSSACPEFELTVSGLTSEDTEALTARVADYTDGYRATTVTTYSEEYNEGVLASSEQESNLAFGASLTADEAPNGFYSIYTAFGADPYAESSEPELWFTDSDSAGLADGDAWLFVGDDCMELGDYDTDADGDYYNELPEYEYGMDPYWGETRTYAEGDTLEISFNMPKNPCTETEGATIWGGDRLEVGDLILVFSGTYYYDEPEEECQDTVEGVELTMGAASLAVSVAGAAAIALLH